jgi:hypothetical protein
MLRRRALYDPRLITASPRHAEIYAVYERVYAWADAAAAIAFIVGSVFFLDPEMKRSGEWLFVVGSVLFAVVPLAKHLQAVHMRRLTSSDET